MTIDREAVIVATLFSALVVFHVLFDFCEWILGHGSNAPGAID